jgi:predicted Zn-dependent protease
MTMFFEVFLNKAYSGSTRVVLTIMIMCSLFGCTLKREPVPKGTIPKINTFNLAEENFGQKFYKNLSKKYKLNEDAGQLERMTAVFDRLVQVAEVDHLPWHLHLFDAPDIIDVRAVHGNRLFVWTGFLDTVENDDEVAGILACEIGHVLARHTEPVEFNIWSEIFFETTSLAASLGIMMASQGTVAIGGSGWMKWIYMEAADLDPMDREYDEALEMEATGIALLILARSEYDPTALQTFWKRIQKNPGLSKKAKGLYRDLKPKERIAMLDELMPNLPSWTEQTLEQKGSKTSEVIHDVNAHVNDLSAISGELPPL